MKEFCWTCNAEIIGQVYYHTYTTDHVERQHCSACWNSYPDLILAEQIRVDHAASYTLACSTAQDLGYRHGLSRDDSTMERDIEALSDDMSEAELSDLRACYRQGYAEALARV